MRRIPPAAMALTQNQAQYLRAFVPQGRFFFTVTLPKRRRKFLTEPRGNLRVSCLAARQSRPFTVEAMVILPVPVWRLEIE